MDDFADDIGSWTLLPSGGGRFEVKINGELVFSKLKLGRHPKKAEIAQMIRARIDGG